MARNVLRRIYSIATAVKGAISLAERTTWLGFAAYTWLGAGTLSTLIAGMFDLLWPHILWALVPWCVVGCILLILHWYSRYHFRAGIREDVGQLYSSVGHDAMCFGVDVLNAIGAQLKRFESAHDAVAVLLHTYVIEQCNQARSRLESTLSLDNKATVAVIQEELGNFYEKYHTLRKWIHHGRDLVKWPAADNNDYRRWAQRDQAFLEKARDLKAKSSFADFEDTHRRVGDRSLYDPA